MTEIIEGQPPAQSEGEEWMTIGKTYSNTFSRKSTSQSSSRSSASSEDIEDPEAGQKKSPEKRQMEVQVESLTQAPTCCSEEPLPQQKTMMVAKSPQLKETYYKNRAYLHGWLRNQCVKFKIQTETFANALHLMDCYYSSNSFDQTAFIRQALCMIIISTKALEPKVLYTSTVARNNKLNFQQTLQTECRIFDWFGYRISSHNFVRLASHYMKKWDQMAEQRGLNFMIFSQSQKSFVLYNHILYFCESQLRLKKSLLQNDLKRIFKHTISKGSRAKEEIIDHIFSEPFLSPTEQQKYAFEIAEEEERQEQRNASFSQWEEQYEKKGQSVRSRFKEFRAGDNYGHFLSLIF